MKKVSVAILFLFACAPIFAAQLDCSNGNVNKGEGKFTGQITGGPTGTLIQVTSGNESIVVIYNNSVPVCDGGRPSSIRALIPGATIVAFGRVEKKGKSYQMTASKILVAGPAESPVAARDDWNSGASAPSNSGNSGASQAAGSAAGQDAWQAGPRGETKGGGDSQNSATIACSALIVSITSGEDATGKGVGRASTSGVTCRMSVDQQAMQLAQGAVSRRRISGVRLTCQNQLEATLTNAYVSQAQFATHNGSQDVEITFLAERVELTHTPSGARVTF